MMFEKFEDGEDDVIRVAESRGLAPLRVVQTAHPIDCYVSLLLVQLHCRC